MAEKKVNKEEAVVETKAETKVETKREDRPVKYNRSNKAHKFQKRKRFCKFCAKGIEIVDYKDVDTLKKYINFNNKIMPKKQSGCCTKHQRRVSNAIKRARILALLPFIDEN